MSSPYFLTWLALSLATLASWQLEDSSYGTWVGTVVLFVAFFKARLVLMYFMEVRHAPATLRWCCEAWVILACIAVIASYWYAPLSQ